MPSIIRNMLSLTQELRFLHFSYHKCLTVLYGSVMRSSMSNLLPGGYQHFNSNVNNFHAELPKLKGGSVNNHAIDLSSLSCPYRATCFIRDPRDLTVSGYFYHKRGAEGWANIRNPSPEDWAVVNGNIPKGIKPDQSFSEFLQNVDLETGLLAEIEFRKNHFEAMRKWDYDQPNLFVFKYEDVVGREDETFARIAEIYLFSNKWRDEIVRQARQHSLNNQKNRRHVRNPEPNQWKKYFSENVKKAFYSQYNDIVEKLGYR